MAGLSWPIRHEQTAARRHHGQVPCSHPAIGKSARRAHAEDDLSMSVCTLLLDSVNARHTSPDCRDDMSGRLVPPADSDNARGWLNGDDMVMMETETVDRATQCDDDEKVRTRPPRQWHGYSVAVVRGN